MKRDSKIEYGSSIYDRIETARMSDSERQAALNAMRQADMFVDAITWIAKKIRWGGARPFLKPSLKH